MITREVVDPSCARAVSMLNKATLKKLATARCSRGRPGGIQRLRPDILASTVERHRADAQSESAQGPGRNFVKRNANDRPIDAPREAQQHDQKPGFEVAGLRVLRRFKHDLAFDDEDALRDRGGKVAR